MNEKGTRCCAAGCEKCGGLGCGKLELETGELCCTSKIKDLGKMCVLETDFGCMLPESKINFKFEVCFTIQKLKSKAGTLTFFQNQF